MDQPLPKRTSFWRFSLRELMLLMLAAGAMIGWATVLYRSQQLKPTPFFENNESWQNDVLLIFQELGEPPFKDVPGTIMHSEGPGSVQRTLVFRIPLPPAKKDPFLRALVTKVREKMKKEGCSHSGESSSSSGNVNDVHVLGYSRGIVSGTVQICVMEAGDSETAVTMTMQEVQGMGHGFGLENGRYP
jgi:hypothetical protein